MANKDGCYFWNAEGQLIWDDSINRYEFKHEVSLAALQLLREAGLDCKDVKWLDEMSLKGEAWVKNISGHFKLRGNKICFFPDKVIKGQTAAEVLEAYQAFAGKCALCHQPRSAHHVVKSEVEEGWTIRCPERKG